MSIESDRKLRNSKVLTNSLPHSLTKKTKLSSNSNVESSTNSAEEINRSGRNSPTYENSTQSENEEKFNRLRDEMSMLKAMMEKIISQNEERDKQNGGSTVTSSYAVGFSNNRSVNSHTFAKSTCFAKSSHNVNMALRVNESLTMHPVLLLRECHILGRTPTSSLQQNGTVGQN